MRAEPERRPDRQAEEVDSRGEDVFTHRSRLDRQSARGELLVQLDPEQVHLPQIDPVRVRAGTGAVLHCTARVCVAVDPEPCDQLDLRTDRFVRPVRVPRTHGHDDGTCLHHSMMADRPLAAARRQAHRSRARGQPADAQRGRAAPDEGRSRALSAQPTR